MQFGFDKRGKEIVISYCCIVPLIVRFALSYLFSAVSAKFSDDVFSFLLSAVFNALSWILPFGIYGIFSKFERSEKVTASPKKAVHVFFSSYLLASLLSVGYSYILLFFGFDIPKTDISDYGFALTAIFVVSSVILVPVAEEFAFRKILFSSLLPFGKIPAIIVTAVLFALCHHPASFVYSFVFGVALAVIARECGWKCSVLIHSANNTISCVYIILEQYLSKAAYGVALSIRLFFMAVLGVYCTAMIIKTRCNGGKKS